MQSWFWLFLFLWMGFSRTFAQSGCTDPQALNFDPQAQTNDGSCLYPETNLSPSLVTNLPAVVQETSGLFFACGWLWTHNDSGGNPKLFAIDSTDGSIHKEVVLRTPAVDWEDVTTSPQHVFIGDFGNNFGQRQDLAIYRLSLGQLCVQDTVDADTLRFFYPEQSQFQPDPDQHDYDAEALCWWNQQLHLFTKHRTNGFTRHYRLPEFPGFHAAELVDSLFAGGQVTGASTFGDSLLALVGYTPPFYTPFMLLVWDVPGDLFSMGHKRKITLGSVVDMGQLEAVELRGLGQGFLSSEAVPQLAKPAGLYSFDASAFLLPLTSIPLEMGQHMDTGQWMIRIPEDGFWHMRWFSPSGQLMYKERVYFPAGMQPLKVPFEKGMGVLEISKGKLRLRGLVRP